MRSQLTQVTRTEWDVNSSWSDLLRCLIQKFSISCQGSISTRIWPFPDGGIEKKIH